MKLLSSNDTGTRRKDITGIRSGRIHFNRSRTLKQTSKSDGIRATAAVLFAQKGYSAVGVAELGEATGLGKGALYHHINSKEDLLFDISSKYIKILIEDGREISAQELDPVRRIQKLSTAMIVVVYDHLAEMTVCFREIHALSGDRHNTVAQYHLQYQQIWEDAINMGVAQGVFRPLEKVAIKGIMGMFFYSFLWLNPDGPQTAQEVGKAFSDFIVGGLTAVRD